MKPEFKVVFPKCKTNNFIELICSDELKEKLIAEFPNHILTRTNKVPAALLEEMQANKNKYGKFATNKEINAGGD